MSFNNKKCLNKNPLQSPKRGDESAELYFKKMVTSQCIMHYKALSKPKAQFGGLFV